jgi:hypothetical protein
MNHPTRRDERSGGTVASRSRSVKVAAIGTQTAARLCVPADLITEEVDLVTPLQSALSDRPCG